MATEVFPVEGPWPGTLAISARPRGGDWLEDEMKTWRTAGFDEIVSLLTAEEVEEMDLQHEPRLSRSNDMRFVSFPIADRGVPESRSATLQLVEQLSAELDRGKSINIHCRQGIGRSALIAVSLLMLKGMRPEDAIRRVSQARHTPVPETKSQQDWIDSFTPV